MKNVAEEIRQAALTGNAARVRALIPTADQAARDEALRYASDSKSRMSFALQLASGKGIGYGDMGNLSAFICTDCEILVTLIQSH